MTQTPWHFETLGGAVGVYTSKAHGFGTDALLLAAFAAPKRSDAACDLGSGCGIMPMLWCRDALCARITAVEISADACAQLRSTVEEQGLQEKVQVLHRDLRALRGVLPAGQYDLETMNPPYAAPQTGRLTETQTASVARHEVLCSLKDVCEAADYLLKFGGRCCFCHRPDRLTDVLVALRGAGLEPKRLRFVAAMEGKAPWLLLVEAKKGGKPGVIVQPTLLQKNADGSDSAEIVEIYGEYRN